VSMEGVHVLTEQGKSVVKRQEGASEEKGWQKARGSK
jgi:hypothetical protein